MKWSAGQALSGTLNSDAGLFLPNRD